MKTKPTCKAIRDRLTLYLMGDLDPQTQETIADHLTTCDTCRVVADRLEPTLAQLRETLRDVPQAPTTLSPEHRQRVMAAFQQRKQRSQAPRKRKPLLLRFHVLEMAAAFIAGVMIIGLLMPATFKAERKAKRLSVAMTEPEQIEELEEIEVPASIEGRKQEMVKNMSGIRRGYGRAAAREDARFPAASEGQDSGVVVAGVPMDQNMNGVATFSEKGAFYYDDFSEAPEPPEPTEVLMDISADMPSLPTEAPVPEQVASVNVVGYSARNLSRISPAPSSPKPTSQFRVEETPAPEFSKSLNVPVDSALAAQSGPNPPAPTAQVQPAEFDSVAMVKSPVIFGGMLGSREAGAERERLSALQAANDVPVEIVDAPAKPSGGKGWGFDQSDTLRKAESAKETLARPSLQEPARQASRSPERRMALGLSLESKLAGESEAITGPVGQVQSVAKNEKTKRRKANVADKKIAEEMSGDFISLEGAGLGGAGMVDSDYDGSFFTEMGVVHDENTAPESGERAAKKHRSTGAPHAVAMQAKGEREEKKDYYARSDDRSKSADFIEIEGASSARADEELDGLRIKAAEMREIISELRGRTSDLRGPISDSGSESTSVASRADDSVMLADGTVASYEVEREELEREVQDLTGQIRDMRGQISDVLSAPASGASGAGDFVMLEGGGDAGAASGDDLDAFADSEYELPGNELSAALKDRLQKIRLPEVDFRQAKMEDIVQFYNAQLVEYGDTKQAAQTPAVRYDKSSIESDTLVTFSALDITALETLQYAVDIAGMSIKEVGNTIQIVPRTSAMGEQEIDAADPFAPRFKATGVNPFVSVSSKPFSTFSIDVDTASYTLARNYMLGGHLPPAEAVRTEEFVNFFDYAYQPPVSKTFRVASEIAPSRFGRGQHLLKLGIKGRRLGREEQRQASLTLLIDSSGSMNQPDRLGLVRAALEMLLDELAETDQVAIIQFDNRARLILAHTPVRDRETIIKAIDAIQCGGGTNLETGLQQAYEQAAKAFVSRGENRILLMSDGVVNLGETAADSISARIEASRRQGLYLSVFGFGMGIYDDTMLKTLATKGNGAYAFIDSETEARRVFVDDLSATLNTIAEDVKIQIEFNPRLVDEYRQLGYESRQLTKEQFRDDTVNAGEVGSGQSVTALYELDLADLPVPYAAQSRSVRTPEFDNWIAVARVRYRRVDNGKIEEIEQRIMAADILPSFDAASSRFRLAAGVAAFAEILRGSPFASGVAFDDVASVLRPVSLDLHLDQRIRELVQIVETAGGLTR